MSIANYISKSMEESSWIRKMFEEGMRLKEKLGEENVFDFSIGNPDLRPPDEFFDAIKEICFKPKASCFINEHGYMSNAGYPETREAVAAKVSEDYGVKITGDLIVMTCGAAGGLNVVLKTLLNPGEEVIVPKPYFFEYTPYINNHNGVITFVETNQDFSLNIENINSAINEKTKAVLINSPNNPTGKVYSEKEIKELAQLLNDNYKKNGRVIYLINDESYRELVYDGVKITSILKYYNNSITVTSLSKTLSLAGERIGFITVNPSCDDTNTLMSGLIICNRILGYINAPALMQRVIAKILNKSVDINIYKRKRDLFISGLVKAGYQVEKPDGAFYIFPKCPIKDDVEFVRHLLKYNILAVPGVGFLGPGYFRLSYAVPEEVIARSFSKFKEAIESI